MKSKIYAFAVAALLLVTTSSYATVVDNKKPKKDRIERRGETADKSARMQQVKARVHEIRDMDKSTLTQSEKKELKNELKGLKKEARAAKGVYLSVGAIIIIILLLILIL